jgi:hypothetical protein
MSDGYVITLNRPRTAVLSESALLRAMFDVG